MYVNYYIPLWIDLICLLRVFLLQILSHILCKHTAFRQYDYVVYVHVDVMCLNARIWWYFCNISDDIFAPNFLPHILHSNRFSPEWHFWCLCKNTCIDIKIKCLFSDIFSVNVLSHNSQAYGFSTTFSFFLDPKHCLK